MESGATGPCPTDMGENDPEEVLRLILIGNTGSGKSASGNTILGQAGQRPFKSICSPASVTQVCQLGTSGYHAEEEAKSTSSRRSKRKKVAVVDMPGFGDTQRTQEQIITEISKSMVMMAPGPHAFLLVLKLECYSEEVKRAVEMIAEVYGEAALRNYTVVLFARGDELEDLIEEYLSSSADFMGLIHRCGGRYHVFNNKDQGDGQQVLELLKKVEKVVDFNGGGCYTNAMYQEVEAAKKKEKLRKEEELRKEEPARKEEKLRKEEELRKEEQARKVEELRKEEPARIERESKSSCSIL